MNAALGFAPPSGLVLDEQQTGGDIMASSSPSDPQQVHREISRFLDNLLDAPAEGKTYFLRLEEARVAIASVAAELARGYLNRPLPFNEQEERLFQAVVALWLKTARAYAQCAEKDASDEDSADRRVTMILNRCLYYTGMAIVEHQRVQREPPWGLWLDLHGYFASAEDWGVATLIVPDALESHGRGSQCTATYVGFLLGDMACRAGLSLSEQTTVRRWAVLWSPLVTLHKAPEGTPLPEYVVDLMQDVALRPARDCGQRDFVRRLDTSRLIQHIAQTRAKLKQNVAPAELALGDEASAGQCSRLLERIARPWSQTRAPRRFPRHAAAGNMRLCTGFEEMHYFVSGKTFQQPERERTLAMREEQSPYALRPRSQPPLIQPLQEGHAPEENVAFTTDVWQAVDQSATGFRLARRRPGRKIAHGQLLALCADGGDHFLLAQTRWLRQEKEGGLVGGIKALPGVPVAVAARALDHASAGNGRYHRAFLLPEIPAIAAEPSLVMPHGWFRPGRVVELVGDGIRRIRLRRLIEDGFDFERVSFIAC